MPSQHHVPSRFLGCAAGSPNPGTRARDNFVGTLMKVIYRSRACAWAVSESAYVLPAVDQSRIPEGLGAGPLQRKVNLGPPWLFITVSEYHVLTLYPSETVVGESSSIRTGSRKGVDGRRSPRSTCASFAEGQHFPREPPIKRQRPTDSTTIPSCIRELSRQRLIVDVPNADENPLFKPAEVRVVAGNSHLPPAAGAIVLERSVVRGVR